MGKVRLLLFTINTTQRMDESRRNNPSTNARMHEKETFDPSFAVDCPLCASHRAVETRKDRRASARLFVDTRVSLLCTMLC